MLGKTLLRASEGLALGGWFGSWALFALVIAPVAFATLPADAAGRLVGPVLRALHYYGMAAGFVLFAIAFALDRSRAARLLPLALAILCGVSEFAVTSSITEVRPSTYGAGTPAEAGADFQWLHLLSRLLFIGVLLGTMGLIALHARVTSAAEPAAS
jgi:hypothetical protein